MLEKSEVRSWCQMRPLDNILVRKIRPSSVPILYRVIQKSLRDFRPLRYSSRDGHAEGEHVNRKRDTRSFCPTLQVLDICWLLRAPDKRFSHTLDSLGRWPRPASSFRSAQAATLLEFHVPLTNCFLRRWFCTVHGPKSPLHRHNWLSFGKFQTQNAFLFTVHAIFRHDYPLAVEPASTPRPLVPREGKKGGGGPLRDSLPIDMLLSVLSFLVVVQSSSEVPEGLMNNPVLLPTSMWLNLVHVDVRGLAHKSRSSRGWIGPQHYKPRGWVFLKQILETPNPLPKRKKAAGSLNRQKVSPYSL